MKSQYLLKTALPDTTGVYIFKDVQKRPLYIGRATSIRDRVKSYFSNDIIETRGPRIVDMVSKARSLDWRETSSVLEAIILENSLIKKYQPNYNVDDRDDKSSQYVVVTDEPWPRVFLARARDFDRTSEDGRLPYRVKKRFGPYPNAGLIKAALKVLRKIFPFRDKKSLDPKHDAFYRALGRSPKQANESDRLLYLRTIDRLVLFFEDKKKKLFKELDKQMNDYAKELKFEYAGDVKRTIQALNHVNDVSLIKLDRKRVSEEFRSEAYDVAHLSGTEAVGVMAVSLNGENAPSEYRRFKLRRNENDDLSGLAEILDRRLNHSEWRYPDLIVVDGNEIHLSRVENVLKARRVGIPVVAVVKDERHKASRIIGPADLLKSYKKEIVSLNAEAHRAAVKYHRMRRMIGFKPK